MQAFVFFSGKNTIICDAFISFTTEICSLTAYI